jgi:small subunit ribosomal protein S14
VSGQQKKPDQTMASESKNVRYKKQIAKLEASRKPDAKVKMPPRERIRIRFRCKLCGRPRAVYRKFGICRICFRNMASDGLIPGVVKASW